MTHGRVRLPSIAVLGAVVGATALACEPDHNRDVPGPPKIISAYVGTADFTGLPVVAVSFGVTMTCDSTDPRSWGGNFSARPDPMMPAMPVRCIPDVLHPPDPMNPIDQPMNGFPWNSAVRLVFNEGLDGDKIEDQNNVTLVAKLKDNVVTATGPTGQAIAINNGETTSMGGASYYDPAGADFKQGIYGTAPPGPGIMVVPGTGNPVGANGLPAGGSTKICANPALVTDVAGNGVCQMGCGAGFPASEANCVSISTEAFAVASSMPGMGDSISAANLASMGITVTFNAPIDDKTSNLSAANFKIEVACTPTTCINVPGMCYAIAVDRTSDPTVVTITPTGAAGCPAMIPAGPARLTIAAATTDQWGVQLMTAKVVNFTITP